MNLEFAGHHGRGLRRLLLVLAISLIMPLVAMAQAGGEQVGTVHWLPEMTVVIPTSEVVQAFMAASGKRIDAGRDDHSSIGLFASKQTPFDVLACNHFPTPVEQKALTKRFPPGDPQPSIFTIGWRQTLAIVNNNNSVRQLSLADICKMLRVEGKQLTWRTFGGGGSSIHCYSEGAESWSRSLVRRKCMPSVEKMEGYTRYGWWPFRDDFQTCDDAAEVVNKVKGDSEAIGFVQYTGQDLKGVKILAIRQDENSPFITAKLEPVIQNDYPLSEPLVLYLQPKAPESARAFCEFAAGAEGSAILEKSGLITPCMQYQAEGKARLAEMKAGKGRRLWAIGFNDASKVVPDLTTEFVKAKTVVQVGYMATDSDVGAVGLFVKIGAASKPATTSVSPTTALASSTPVASVPATTPASAPVSVPLITPFVAAGGKELLFLADRPSEQAMKLHGEKWNALGLDEQGQPNGTGPAEYVIAGHATAIIVNPANKIEALTPAQIQAIFDGEVDDWAIIGETGLTASGGTIHINAFGLNANDPATVLFEKECLPRDKWKHVTTKKDTSEALAAVSMDPQAIAFVDLSDIPATGQTVKVLGIRMNAGKGADGKPATKIYPPTAENIRSAMYPLSSRMFLYVHPQASDTAKDFAKFIATCGGSEASPYADTVKAMMDAYQKNGLIPLSDSAIEHAAKDAIVAAKAKEAASQAAKGKK